MKQENNATTRVKKYEDLRQEIKKMDDGVVNSKTKPSKKEDVSKTRTIPINNNEGINTEAIEKTAPIDKNTKTVDNPIFKTYRKRKIITTSLYILAALVVLAIVILIIIFVGQNL